MIGAQTVIPETPSMVAEQMEKPRVSIPPLTQRVSRNILNQVLAGG